ncbi:MAG: molybdopterin-dependent oxidoreductase, partial [Bdellovibrionales bacterium]|nr:molybdopterin-dependent oxidoreductase [Bdellovibrionales bacterium]
MSISRRQFIIKGLQGTGVLALSIPVISCTSKYKCADTQSGDMIFSTHYFEITKDGQFSLVMDKTDMGQGTTTLFSSLFAEEAEIPLERIQIVPAKVDPAYNTGMGVQITGGSTSTSDRFLTIREAGAFLKATMLYAAAAKTGEPVESLKAEKGHIKTSKILIPYGDLIEWAEVQKINNYPLKDKKDFKILGKERPMVDSFEKSTGKAEYGIDKKLENMVVAVVLRPPHFTARLKSFNYDKLNSQPGFVDCFAIASGVAIVFEKYWQTLKTRDLVDIEWESGSSAQLTSQEIFDRYKKDISQKKGDKVVEEGDLEKVFQSGKTVEAEYHLPYLAHATMEPMNCVAWYQGDSLDIYSPNQGPTLVRNASAALVGLPREKVFVHTTKFLGGGFGRRSTLDYNLEAVEVSKKLKRPVKLMWSRED